MKFLLLSLCFLSSSLILFSQSESIVLVKEAIDTVVRYVDASGRIQNEQNAPFTQKTWRENEKYNLLLYTNNAQHKLVRKTTYADEKFQILDGPFEEYYPNGQLKDKGNYTNKQRNGIFKSWYENGNLLSEFHYANGIRTDTGKSYYENGELYLYTVTDKQGNGTETIYHPDGSIKMTGLMKAGKKEGTWLLTRKNGTRQMQLEFSADSVAGSTCFGEDGISIAEGPCIYERFARFPGGTEGWRNFLTTNLKYPRKAIQNDIEGTVMLGFTVDTSGNIVDLKVISSPHEWLSEEALRLMQISPKWEPAIQYNKPVKGKLRQPIYFRLQ